MIVLFPTALPIIMPLFLSDAAKVVGPKIALLRPSNCGCGRFSIAEYQYSNLEGAKILVCIKYLAHYLSKSLLISYFQSILENGRGDLAILGQSRMHNCGTT
jgi:hypothetical protein